jgi:3,4-dihydroxy 2-butanone 4-phosphate synthase/GTP cyclohydrolase II
MLSTDLCRLAGRQPVGVISEIALDNGYMARRDDLLSFSKEHGLRIITIHDLKQYILEKSVSR